MKSLVAAAALLALPAAAAAQMPSPAAGLALAPDRTLLSVTAEGQSRRTPDIANFSAGVVTQATTANEALAANATRMSAVIAALKRAGIADRDIQTSAISLQPRYSNPERDAQLRARMNRTEYVPPAEPESPRIVGYDARNTVQVRVRRLGEMGRVIDTLVAQGANQVDGPAFSLDEPQPALDEARTEAMAAAQKRAELYARAAGLRVLRIISISEQPGFYPVQDIIVTGRSAGFAAPPPPPPTPVAPGQLNLGIQLSVQFELGR